MRINLFVTKRGIYPTAYVRRGRLGVRLSPRGITPYLSLGTYPKRRSGRKKGWF